MEIPATVATIATQAFHKNAGTWTRTIEDEAFGECRVFNP
jgi:hypothetical protein